MANRTDLPKRASVAGAELPWFTHLASGLLMTEPIHTGEVHAQDTSRSAQHATYELMNVQLHFLIPDNAEQLAAEIQPNIAWADEHFIERVGGAPLNPAPSHERWPFAQANNDAHTRNNQFSHTYPERFWPRHAGLPSPDNMGHRGIRYGYGDLSDVVHLLARNPLTRQAYLPVWFPEDLTAAWMGERVPCTIGYHFMIRDDKLHCWYTMRSCDFVRYLRDDVYLAGRLMQWVCDQVIKNTNDEYGVNDSGGFVPGNLHMTISSLHAFVGDKWTLERITSGS